MTKRITSYEELLVEKQRLELLMDKQKELVRQDILSVKEQLAPVRSAISFIGKLTTREPGNPLISGVMNTAIDLLLRNIVLSRAGWLARLAIPFVVKNFTSHAIDEQKDSLIRKVFSWFGNKKKAESNGKFHHMEEEE